MKDIKVSFTSTEQDVYEIRSWIDYPDSNISTVYDCYKNNSLIIATLNNKVIAYYALIVNEVSMFISLAEVKKEFRNKGVGKIILNEIERKFYNTQYKALYLYCSPQESQFYWKKIGFDYFPENLRKNRNEKTYMYKIINPILESIDHNQICKTDEHEYLEVWNDKSSFVEDIAANWIWKLDFVDINSRILKFPFLFFGDDHWKVRWSKGDKIIKECDYKYFDRKNEIYECMFIDKMPNFS